MTGRARKLALAVPLLAGLAACSLDGAPPTDVGSSPSGDEKVGEAWTAGLNGSGQLGRSRQDMDVAVAPVQGASGGGSRLTGVVAVAAGSQHSLALTSDGRVLAWGANRNGQLGDGTRRPNAAPTPVRAPDGRPGVLDDVTEISAAGGLSMALRENGTVVTWGAGGNGQRGTARRGVPGLPTTVASSTGTGPLTGVASIAAAELNAYAVLKDGAVLAWGSNHRGGLGNGTRDARGRRLPGPVLGPGGTGRLTGITRLAIGRRHVLALRRDGGVVAWGTNVQGQLGDGTLQPRFAPVPVLEEKGQGVPLRDITKIAAGGMHSYAVRRDGMLLAWGANSEGQLGNGSTTASLRPIPVSGPHTPALRGVADIVAGRSFGVSLLTSGSALSWGAAGKGQLGAGNRLSRSRPGPLIMSAGNRPKAVLAAAAGDQHLVLLVRP